jgi:AAA family ATP:ADP antiporter
MERPQRATIVERFLGLFTEVRNGEGATVLLLTLNFFLILTAYYIIKPLREALILSGEGAEVKSYSAAGQAILLLILVPLYAALASRVSRRKLINTVTLFFTGCLIGFYILGRLDVPLGVVFFLWVGIFSLMVIAQFWAFSNDIYSPEEGKRLFVLIQFGASSGAVFGAFAAGPLIGRLGVFPLMLVGAAILALSLLLTNWVERRERNRVSYAQGGTPVKADEAIGGEGAFKTVFSSKYLILIALLILLLNWVNTTGEYVLGKTVQNAAAEAVSLGTAEGLNQAQFIGKFYSDFFGVVNLAGMLIQLFLVSRILKYLGVSVAILLLPLIALGGYTLLAFYPVLGVVRWIKTAENSTDYSLHNTVRAVLFLPTSRAEKYKGKQAIDSFFYRAGDVLSAVVVYAGTTWLMWKAANFAVANMVLVAAWLTLAVLIGREYRRLVHGQREN